MKKILLIGGTGALGTYLTQELVCMGYNVDVVSMDEKVSIIKNLRYFQRDAKELAFLTELLKNEYDAIVDFMIYHTVEEFAKYCHLFLDNTAHYLYLSSYRVYANAKDKVTEETVRLLDALPDGYIKANDYAIYKAECEDYLRATGKNNWTILRPTITFSKRRFQLTVLEGAHFIHRMHVGKTVLLPKIALDAQATLSWAGDFGKMVARLIFNPSAFGEAYTVGTAEHHSWREMAEIYGRIGGLKYQAIETEDFLDIVDGHVHFFKQGLFYDRCLNRAIDNTKILNATGFKQSDLMPTEVGLRMELSQLDLKDLPNNTAVSARMDAFLGE